MLVRQNTLLRICAHHDEPITRLRLVKLAFLLKQGEPLAELKTFYRFLPYKHGPFSFTLYHELESLLKKSYLTEGVSNKLYANKELLPQALGISAEYTIKKLVFNYRQYTDSHLASIIYAKYPWYTLNASNPKLRKVKKPKAQKAIYLIGYEGLQVEDLLNRLLKTGIRQLIDIRANPVARRYGFHKSRLDNLCGHLGIKYQHVPELGIPSEWRHSLESYADYKKLFERYNAEVLPEQGEAIERVSSIIKKTPSAMMCMEAKAKYCHRSHLAKAVAKGTSLQIINL